MVDTNGIVEVKDFEFDPTPKRFRLYKGDDFIFEAMPALPLGLASSATKLGETLKNGDLTQLLKFFDEILLEESAQKMREYADSKTKPLGANQIMPIIMWLLEEYGLRPTQPSSPSSTPSGDDGITSSTAGVQDEELTHSDSASPDSSTSSTSSSSTDSE